MAIVKATTRAHLKAYCGCGVVAVLFSLAWAMLVDPPWFWVGCFSTGMLIGSLVGPRLYWFFIDRELRRKLRRGPS